MRLLALLLALPLAAVELAEVRLIDHPAVEVLPGTVRPAQAATLMARIPGVVQRIDATPGASVAAGTVLAELDALEVAAQRDQAQAQAAGAAADVARVRELFAKQAVTKAELDAAEARAAATAAAVRQAEVMLSYTHITAPFAGRIVRRHAEVGDLLAPGRAVVEIEDPASLRLEIEVPETLANRAEQGASLRVQVPAAGIDTAAPVVEVEPAANPVSRTVLVKLALPLQPALRSGQFGRATVTVAAGQVLAVPAAALVHRGQLDGVFVVVDGVARLRLVRPGGAVGSDVAIRAGLAAGERVVVNPGDLRDGAKVQ